jgi:hypothetical protein
VALAFRVAPGLNDAPAEGVFVLLLLLRATTTPATISTPAPATQPMISGILERPEFRSAP